MMRARRKWASLLGRRGPSALVVRRGEHDRVLAAVGLVAVAASGCSLWEAGDTPVRWQQWQARYNEAASDLDKPTIRVASRASGSSQLGTEDTCVTCHVGMSGAGAIAGEELFAAHPDVVHDPAEFGCTLCHGGDGAALASDVAHGRVQGGQPMLERPYFRAACGTCHSHIPVIPPQTLERGEQLLESRSCTVCHEVGGSPGGAAPDLTYVGLRRYDPLWHDKHTDRSMAAESGPWADAFEPLSESELADVAALFRGLVGMPKLVAGKRLAASFGCRGCHKIYGVGGDKGPDLTSLRSRVRDTDAVPSRSLSLWLKEHFVSPNTAVPGSEMPNLGITPEQAELLTLYVLSLSPRPIPEPLIPNDRILGLHLGQRDFPPDGGSLFRAFCVGCHGSGGEGRRFGVRIATYPALANQDFLAIASDEFLRKSIEKGRPGRGMPAWLSEHSGLRRDEIDAIVAYVRGFQTKAPTFHEVMAQVPEAELGARVFDEQCAACHGADAEGTVLAPPLSASDNPVARNANAVYGTLTVGIAGTAMGSFRTLSPLEMKAVIDWVGRLPPTEPTRGHWRSQPGESERGRIAYGKYCVACHGGAGEGGLGPQLANAGLAEVANDGYLVATLVRGRRGALMPGFGHPTSSDLPMLSPVEIADLVAFLRSLAAQKR